MVKDNNYMEYKKNMTSSKVTTNVVEAEPLAVTSETSIGSIVNASTGDQTIQIISSSVKVVVSTIGTSPSVFFTTSTRTFTPFNTLVMSRLLKYITTIF